MGKFTEQERDRIQESLISEGTSLYSTFGLKKTSVEQITKACGIAKGTFYLFYQSKEDLLLKIIEEEEIKIHKTIKSQVYKGISAEAFAGVLTETYLDFFKHSVSRTLYILNEFPLLFRKVSKEKAQENMERDLALSKYLIDIIPIPNIKPDVFSGLLRSVFLSTLHKSVIGEDLFDEVIKLQIKFIAKGLFVEKGG